MSFDLPALPSEWAYLPLDRCAVPGSISYGVVQPGPPVISGVPIIRVNNFKGTQLDLADVMRIAPEIESKYARTRLSGGEVLLTLVGSIGQVAEVPPGCLGFNVARAVGVIKPTGEISAKWIATCLRSSLSQLLLGSRANTTVQTTINLKDVRALPIPIPPPRERERIEKVVAALDDKASLLRETNATLEAIAQALFKSWFVDFEPVRAKQQGFAPVGMDVTTAALFPDAFEESQATVIPKGWRHSSVRDNFHLTMGQSPPGDTYNQVGVGVPFYQGRADFGFRFPNQRVFCTAPTRMAKPGDALVSVRAPVGDVNMALDECCLGRGVASVRHPHGLRGFTFYTVQLLKLHFQVFDNEGTVFGSINKKDFEALPVIAPRAEIAKAFEQIASTIDEQVIWGEQQLRTLATLRDTLLPRLISGQLRIPEAEARVAEAIA